MKPRCSFLGTSHTLTASKPLSSRTWGGVREVSTPRGGVSGRRSLFPCNGRPLVVGADCLVPPGLGVGWTPSTCSGGGWRWHGSSCFLLPQFFGAVSHTIFSTPQHFLLYITLFTHMTFSVLDSLHIAHSVLLTNM
jgi:hypothetical protein